MKDDSEFLWDNQFASKMYTTLDMFLQLAAF